jgi:hypothetical protein
MKPEGPSVPKWWACVIERDERIHVIAGPFNHWGAAQSGAVELLQRAGVDALDRIFGFTRAAPGEALRVEDVFPVTLSGCVMKHSAAHSCSGCAR